MCAHTLQSHRLAHFATRLSAIANVGQNAHMARRMCSKALAWTPPEMADSHGMYYIRSCMYACLFFLPRSAEKWVFYVLFFEKKLNLNPGSNISVSSLFVESYWFHWCSLLVMHVWTHVWMHVWTYMKWNLNLLVSYWWTMGTVYWKRLNFVFMVFNQSQGSFETKCRLLTTLNSFF